MEKEKMLVTQALNELKLLDSRINREIRTASFVSAAKKSEKKVTPNVTKEEFNTNAKSEMQSIEDLIDRRARIKKATVASNAVTTLEVNGETMTRDAILCFCDNKLSKEGEYEALLSRGIIQG